MVNRTRLTGQKCPVLFFNTMGVNEMPGKILSAVTRKRIADCHVKSIEFISDRQGLIEVWQAARLSLEKGEHFDRVVNALAKRANDLGVYKKKGR